MRCPCCPKNVKPDPDKAALKAGFLKFASRALVWSRMSPIGDISPPSFVVPNPLWRRTGRIAAKHKNMNKTPKDQLRDSKPQLTRITRMLRRIQASVQSARGKSSTNYPEMAEWTGIPEGTIRDWLNDNGQLCPRARWSLRIFSANQSGWTAFVQPRSVILSAVRMTNRSVASPEDENLVLKRLSLGVNENCFTKGRRSFIVGDTLDNMSGSCNRLRKACNQEPGNRCSAGPYKLFRPVSRHGEAFSSARHWLNHPNQ